MSSYHEMTHYQDNDFNNEEPCYQIMDHPFHYLILMQRSYSEQVSKALLPYNISKYEWRILASLHESEILTVTDLAFIAQIDKTRTSRHVECLAKRKLINRTQGKSDRRCAVVTLTTQGEAVYREIIPLVTKLRNMFFLGVSDDDYQVFLNVLKQAKINCTQLDP